MKDCRDNEFCISKERKFLNFSIAFSILFGFLCYQCISIYKKKKYKKDITFTEKSPRRLDFKIVAEYSSGIIYINSCSLVGNESKNLK